MRKLTYLFEISKIQALRGSDRPEKIVDLLLHDEKMAICPENR